MNAAVRRFILAAALLLPGQGRADPGHELRIEDLNKQIAANPDLPELYFQRAMNYREVPQLAAARADLEKTLSLQKGFLPAERELARLDAAEGKSAEAIARLERVLAAPPADAAFHVPGCYEVLAEFYLNAGRNDDALAALQRVFGLTREVSLDIYLLRSEAQRRLGKKEDRVRDLAAGREKLKSFVLRIAWIEALIDAGRTAEALPEINQEIDSSRYKSSWLIRRARVYLHDGRKAEADTDLETALAEISLRLRPENPDLSLVCDRALIHALQGKVAEARKELDDARARGAFQWTTRIVETVLAAAEQAPATKGK
jgi:tetratricopeptide (TPR) repeat protein